jgi:hypothetical protein
VAYFWACRSRHWSGVTEENQAAMLYRFQPDTCQTNVDKVAMLVFWVEGGGRGCPVCISVGTPDSRDLGFRDFT